MSSTFTDSALNNNHTTDSLIKAGSTVVINGVVTEPYAYLNGKLGTVESRIGDRWLVKLSEPRAGEEPAVKLKDKNLKLATVYDTSGIDFDSLNDDEQAMARAAVMDSLRP